MNIAIYVIIALVVLVLIIVKMSLIIIPQSETKIIERLGKYYATLKPGINIIIPFIDRAKTIVAFSNGRYFYTNNIDLREQVYDFDKQNVITKDNIQMQINALLYFQIVDPFKAVYEINNLPNAIEKLTQTTLRNIIGELELDETLTSRDTINTKLRSVLDDATNKWGIKVNRVELQDITPPQSVLQAMEKQMQAERNKRATILTSEARKPPPSSSRKARRLHASTRPRPTSRPQYCRPREPLRHAYAVPKPKPRPLRKSPRPWAKAPTRPTTCWPRNTSTCSTRWPAATRPRPCICPTRPATSWAR